MLKAFLSYRYEDRGTALASKIKFFLQAAGLQVLDGRSVEAASSLPMQIMARIDGCDLLVLLRSKGEDGDFLLQEGLYAKGKGKPVIVIAEEMAVGGLLSGDYQILLSKDEIGAMGNLLTTVNSIKMKRGLSSEPKQVRNDPRDVIESEGWSREVLDRIFNIRAVTEKLEYGKALEESQRLYNDYPDCWRAGIAIGARLVLLDRLDEADAVIDEVIQRFRGNGRALSHAWQNKGWINFCRREEQGRHDPELVKEAIRCWKRSKDFEPRLVPKEA
jgi:hypothetical protein